MKKNSREAHRTVLPVEQQPLAHPINEPGCARYRPTAADLAWLSCRKLRRNVINVKGSDLVRLLQGKVLNLLIGEVCLAKERGRIRNPLFP